MSGEDTARSVRERLERIAWVGVLLVVVVMGLLAMFAVRYVITVDTMRAWVTEDGTVLAEVPDARAGRVAEGQPARVRIESRWYEGVVVAVGENPSATSGGNGLGAGERYVRVRIVVSGTPSLASGVRAEVRIGVGEAW